MGIGDLTSNLLLGGEVILKIIKNKFLLFTTLILIMVSVLSYMIVPWHQGDAEYPLKQ